MSSSGSTAAAVHASNDEIAEQVGALVGEGAARKLQKSEQDLEKLISDFAYDWRNALKKGITECDIDEQFDVTFHCSGGDGVTLFWFDAAARTPPHNRLVAFNPGEAPPLDLAEIISDATLPQRPDAFLERLAVAYRRGERWAHTIVVGAKALGAIIVIGALIALVPPAREAFANALRWIRGHFTRPVINEQWRQPARPPKPATADAIIRG